MLLATLIAFYSAKHSKGILCRWYSLYMHVRKSALQHMLIVLSRPVDPVSEILSQAVTGVFTEHEPDICSYMHAFQVISAMMLTLARESYLSGLSHMLVTSSGNSRIALVDCQQVE